LIEHVLRVKGPAYLCDEIRRDEDEYYVTHHFRWDILSYVSPAAFRGKRVMDFGSGSGASTMVLARLLDPGAEIVGVELVAPFVDLARHRAAFYGVDQRVSFRSSPDSMSLPDNIGEFDYVVFSAVFEHLLPAERRTLLPVIWDRLKPGGLLFLDQTPYRWFPVEFHTTGLPLLNYFPDRLARWAALRLCGRLRGDESWEELLRKGIRGSTVSEILHILNGNGHRAELLNPCRNGVSDHIDLWYRLSSTTRLAAAKKAMMLGIRAVKTLTGVAMVPTLSLAFRKIA
jgi:SAM-dependent methyltransferase